MSTQETTTMLEDRKVNVKAKLALLWVALMFFYIYNDIFSLWQQLHTTLIELANFVRQGQYRFFDDEIRRLFV